ncbi:MAG: hypothetical protein NZ898_15590 [Myxococcota bacterium]|nr:hypothetical protein [Myxococcota bacterium]
MSPLSAGDEPPTVLVAPRRLSADEVAAHIERVARGWQTPEACEVVPASAEDAQALVDEAFVELDADSLRDAAAARQLEDALARWGLAASSRAARLSHAAPTGSRDDREPLPVGRVLRTETSDGVERLRG